MKDNFLRITFHLLGTQRLEVLKVLNVIPDRILQIAERARSFNKKGVRQDFIDFRCFSGHPVLCFAVET